MTLFLASASTIRQTMLRDAGIPFEPIRPEVDEDALKGELDQGGAALALALARAKAASTSAEGWVLGADSVVEVNGKSYDKPRDRAEAAAHLRAFSGQDLTLSSAAALTRDGQADWSVVDTATLRVRPLSDAFIESYLEAEWPEVGHCVGVFRMEARGVQLFSSIAGSHFTILGLPLLPLLGALRDRGLAPA